MTSTEDIFDVGKIETVCEMSPSLNLFLNYWAYYSGFTARQAHFPFFELSQIGSE